MPPQKAHGRHERDYGLPRLGYFTNGCGIDRIDDGINRGGQSLQVGAGLGLLKDLDTRSDDRLRFRELTGCRSDTVHLNSSLQDTRQKARRVWLDYDLSEGNLEAELSVLSPS